MHNSINKSDTDSINELETKREYLSDTEDTSDIGSTIGVPHYVRPSKRQRILNISSESEDDTETVVSEENESTKRFPWEKKDLKPIIHNFDNSNSGIKADINKQSSILDVFQLFFPEELVTFIVEQTNKYMYIYYMYIAKDDESSVSSHIHNWNETTIHEMYSFLAVTMLMSQIRKLSLHEYWSKDKIIRTESFGEIISRDRYLLILRMLQFHDSIADTDDPLIKIRPIVEKLRASFSKVFLPYEKLCIIDDLLLFKGKCFCKQYIPSKRNRFGIRSFMLCDCKTGYIQDLIVYSGARTETQDDILPKLIGKSGKIVMALLQPYLGKGHTIVTNDWYSSPTLFVELHKNLTNAFGTVRETRLGISDLNEKLRKGEHAFRSTDNLLALKWMDKREVWMISTCHSADMVKAKKVNYQVKKQTAKPQCVTDYSNSMNAVGKIDMFFNSTNSIRKTLKWYKKYFFHLLDLAIYNAYILYKHATEKNLSFAHFHLNLIKHILEKYGERKRFTSKGRNIENEPLRLMQRHFPSKRVNEAAIRKNARRKCVVCAKNERRSESRFECKECDVGLCIEPCFEVYHTVLDY